MLEEPACACLSLLTSLTELEYDAQLSRERLLVSAVACASLPRLRVLNPLNLWWPEREHAIEAVERLARSPSLRLLKVQLHTERYDRAPSALGRPRLKLAEVRKAAGPAVEVQWSWWD
jgi:hypothetical protein